MADKGLCSSEAGRVCAIHEFTLCKHQFDLGTEGAQVAPLLDTMGPWHETAPQAGVGSGPGLDGPSAGHLSAPFETLVKSGMLLIKSVILGMLASPENRVEIRRLGYHPDL